MRIPVLITAALAASVCVAPIVSAAPAAHGAATGSARPAYGVTWTADAAADSLIEYAASASGPATPIATISGPDTALATPTAVALDADGNVYAANSVGASITEYASTASGDAAPIATITGPKTSLSDPRSLAFANDELWVANPAADLIEAFSPGSSGDELPAETISGSRTRLDNPVAIAADEDMLWVANDPASGTPSLLQFDTHQPGDVVPDERAAGSKTHLVSPTSIAIAGNLFFATVWVTDRSTNSLSEFDPDFGPINQAPETTIQGANTHLDAPAAVSVDAVGRLTVANGGDDTIRVFGAKASGNASPERTITGSTATGVTVFAAPPGVPTALHVVAESGGARFRWHAPADTGGGVRSYEVAAFPFPTNPGRDFTTSARLHTTRTTSFTFHHLRNGTRYGFQVSAINGEGEGGPPPFKYGVPLGLPTSPRGVAATSGRRSVTIVWARPANDGGRSITHYRVEAAVGCAPGARGCAFHSQLVAASHRQLRIRGLTTGTRYRLRVLAHSSVGDSPPSKVVRATVR